MKIVNKANKYIIFVTHLLSHKGHFFRGPPYSEILGDYAVPCIILGIRLAKLQYVEPFLKLYDVIFRNCFKA